MEPIARDLRNETTKSKYASLAAVDRAIRPAYTKHGLAPTFTTRASPKGELWITIVGDLVHVGGGHREYVVDSDETVLRRVQLTRGCENGVRSA
jgi:hypothetical protein